jgi:hypothetical protein
MADAAYFPAGITIIIDRYEPMLNPEDEQDVFWQHKPEHYIELVDKFFNR